MTGKVAFSAVDSRVTDDVIATEMDVRGRVCLSGAGAASAVTARGVAIIVSRPVADPSAARAEGVAASVRTDERGCKELRNGNVTVLMLAESATSTGLSAGVFPATRAMMWDALSRF